MGMAKKNKVEEELNNPKGIDMCEFESKYYNKCAGCPKSILDMLFCRITSLNYNQTKTIKLQELQNNLLNELLNVMKEVKEKIEKEKVV
jgi:hypothetical protein